MPAISPNGQFMVYRSEAIDSEGFHLFDFSTRTNNRITIRRQDILPRWGGDNTQFIFVAQEPATKRWQVELGFADGKSDPLILRDGRTPDWSTDNRFIAYQGADAEGNNPGIYLVPFNGGETQRITTHESDRAPDFSPNGSQLTYMSTQSGNWDIYTVSTSGDVPRQLTTSGGNDGLPVWSPDGSKIAYVSDAGGSWGIYVISAAGGTPTKLTPWDGNKRPDWLLAQISWSR
jgi:TolB protein